MIRLIEELTELPRYANGIAGIANAATAMGRPKCLEMGRLGQSGLARFCGTPHESSSKKNNKKVVPDSF